jgi:hypothetical protein
MARPTNPMRFLRFFARFIVACSFVEGSTGAIHSSVRKGRTHPIAPRQVARAFLLEELFPFKTNRRSSLTQETAIFEPSSESPRNRPSFWRAFLPPWTPYAHRSACGPQSIEGLRRSSRPYCGSVLGTCGSDGGTLFPTFDHVFCRNQSSSYACYRRGFVNGQLKLVILTFGGCRDFNSARPSTPTRFSSFATTKIIDARIAGPLTCCLK